MDETTAITKLINFLWRFQWRRTTFFWHLKFAGGGEMKALFCFQWWGGWKGERGWLGWEWSVFWLFPSILSKVDWTAASLNKFQGLSFVAKNWENCPFYCSWSLILHLYVRIFAPRNKKASCRGFREFPTLLGGKIMCTKKQAGWRIFPSKVTWSSCVYLDNDNQAGRPPLRQLGMVNVKRAT